MRIVLALLFLGAATAARAQAPDTATDRARAHVKEGIAYYADGRYEDAAREMEAAYGLKPLPDLQYNLAQCYERLGRLADAVKAYRTYVDGKSGADDREEVTRRIQNLEDRIKSGNATAPIPPPPTEKVVFKTIVVYRDAPPAPGRGARFAAYGLGVVALAALGSGITFTVLAKRQADQVTNGSSQNNPMVFDSQVQSSGKTDVIIAWVSYGVAVAALAGGIGLFLLGNKIDREAPKLTIAPSLAPSGGGLALAGSF